MENCPDCARRRVRMHRAVRVLIAIVGCAAGFAVPTLARADAVWQLVADLKRSVGSTPRAAPLPLGVERYEAPVEYAAIWRGLEQCAGLQGDLERVRFHRARFIAKPRSDTLYVEIYGLWRPAGDSTDIFVTTPAPGAPPSAAVVQHEMLHELLYRGGVTDSTGGHPWPPFGTCVAF